MNKSLTSVIPSFQTAIRLSAVERLKYLCGVEVRVGDMEQPSIPIFGSDLSVITIAGKDLRILFKVHYRMNRILRHFGSGKTAGQCVDFFNEYCNLWAGAIKQVLLSEHLICGISLPTALPGFDEFIFAGKVRQHRLCDLFTVAFGAASIVVSVAVDVHSKAVLDALGACCYLTTENDIEFL
jgi:hypothetical protein